MLRTMTPSGVVKAIVYGGLAAYILFGLLVASLDAPGLDDAGLAAREVLIFFCLSALALVMFRRTTGFAVASLVLVSAGAIQVVQAMGLVSPLGNPLNVVNAGAGVVIAALPVAIGHSFPIQQRGASPTSLNFLP